MWNRHVQLVSEFPPTGGVLNSVQFRPFPAQRYRGPDQSLLILADAVVGLAVLLYLADLARQRCNSTLPSSPNILLYTHMFYLAGVSLPTCILP